MALFADQEILLPYDMLTKVDWMSMQNSLEIRSPFLDYRISELLFNVPGNEKIKGLNLKAVLKTVFKDWLPPQLIKRPKMGFEIPIGSWLKRDKKFKMLFWEYADEVSIKKQGIFNYSKINKLFKEHINNKRDNSHKLWAILVFQWWYHGFFGPGK